MTDISVKKIAPLLLTHEEVAALPASILGQWRLVRLTNGAHHFWYFGTVHSHDIDNPMHTAIERAWEDFLAKTKGHKRTVLFEGWHEPPKDDRDASIIDGTESGLIRYLAKRDGIEEFSPEPRFMDELNFLRNSGFSDREIFGCYFVRTLVQWSDEGSEVSPESYLEPYFDIWHERLSLDRDVGYAELSKSVEQIAGEKLTFGPGNTLPRIISPRVWQSRLNDVGRAVADLRDILIVLQICRLWDKEQSLFIVYGNAHLLRQGPALTQLLGLSLLPATEVLTNG